MFSHAKIVVALLWMTLVLAAGGCRLCSDCDMDAYPAYGGAWERTLRDTGRVGSVFDPGGSRAADLASRTDPETADQRIRGRSQFDNEGQDSEPEDREKRSAEEQRKLDEDARQDDKTEAEREAELKAMEKRLEDLDLQDIRYVEPPRERDWN